MPASRSSAIARVVFAVIMWGGSFVAIKIGIAQVAPSSVVWLRFGIGVLVLAFIVGRRGQLRLPERSEWGYLALLGFLGVTFHQWLQSNGLVTASASSTAWIITTVPVFAALLGWMVLKEKLGLVQILGIGLAALGVILVISKGDLTSVLRGSFGTIGDLLILVSAPNWAVFSVLSRRGLQRFSPAWMMLWVMGLGWLMSTPQFLLGPGLADLPRLDISGWLAILFLGIFCSGIAYVFWYDALAVLPTYEVSVFIYIEPLVTAVLAALMLSEAITLASLLGGAVILLGVWLVQKPQKV